MTGLRLAWLGPLLALCASIALAQAVDPSRVTTSLVVEGNVERKLTLTVDDLKKLTPREIVERRNVSGAGSNADSTRTIKGVLLRDVVDAAKLAEPRRGDLRRSYVVASASDGYAVVFSWGELYNSAIGDGVLVAYERDGAPLPDTEGRIAIVSVNDTRFGPRHVKWLNRLNVRLAE